MTGHIIRARAVTLWVVGVIVMLSEVVGGGPPSPFLPNTTQVALNERYLAPFASKLVDFRTNPISKEYVELADLVDAVPTWLEDLFIPLFIPQSELTFPINKTIDIVPSKILPATITLVNISLANLDELKDLRPLKLLKGGVYTWGGTVDLKKLDVVIRANIKVLGREADIVTNFSLVQPTIDFASIIGFQSNRLCEVWGALMRGSKSCSIWPYFMQSNPDISGFNITTFRVGVSDFDFVLNVTGLGSVLDGDVEAELERLLHNDKSSIIAKLPTTISSTLRESANAGLIKNIEKGQMEAPCDLSKNDDPVVNTSLALNVSRVCVDNNGGYVLKWLYQDCSSGTSSSWTPGYPIDQKRCMNISRAIPNLQQNDILRVSTQATAGVRELADPTLRYVPDSNLASFECSGTTLMHTCKLVSLVPTNPSVLPRASTVCVINQAGFDLRFTGADARSGAYTPSSGSYPIDQTRCINLSQAPGTQPGDQFHIVVHADLGKTHHAATDVIFEDNGLQVSYQCHGTTLDFRCELLRLQ